MPSDLTSFARSPHLEPVGEEGADPADELIRLGCLTYGADRTAHHVAAGELLHRVPGLAGETIAAMAATGSVDALGRALDADPDALDRDTGPFRWSPLLYATYSRIPGANTTPVVAMLLNGGADPNAGFLWEGLVPPFTALTGAFGGGEKGQPAHVDRLTVARLLLEAGADANDGQAVYNLSTGGGMRDDTDWLELLFEFGFGVGEGGVWYERCGAPLGEPHQLVGEVLQHAAEKGLPRRAAALLANGADPMGTGMHPAYDGRTAIEGAVMYGNQELVDLLVDAGADAESVSRLDHVVGRMLAASDAGREPPERADIDLLIAERPGLVRAAVSLDRPEAVRRLVSLGFDVNDLDRITALHAAASGGREAMVRLLLDLGADPTIVDESYNGDPALWAEHNGHTRVAELIRAHST